MINISPVEIVLVQTKADLTNFSPISQTSGYSRVLVFCVETLTFQAYLETSAGVWVLENTDTVAVHLEGGAIKVNIGNDQDSGGNDLWHELDLDYMTHVLSGFNLALLRVYFDREYGDGQPAALTTGEFFLRVLNDAFHEFDSVTESDLTIDTYAEHQTFRAKAILASVLNVADVRFEGVYHAVDGFDHKRAALNVQHLRGRDSNLHSGYVGEIVTFEGARYGLTAPDNLQLCNGGLISHPLAHPNLKGQNAPNYAGNVLCGTGAAFGVNFTQGMTNGAPSIKLNDAMLPEVTLHKPAKNYGFSGYTNYAYATAANQKVWTFDPRATSDAWDSASSQAGSGNSYPADQAQQERVYTTYHRHYFSSYVYVDATTFTFGRPAATQQELPLFQPTIAVDKYIVIY